MKFREMTTCSKLQVLKIKYGHQIRKKVPFQKLMCLAPTLTSFHCFMNRNIMTC